MQKRHTNRERYFEKQAQTTRIIIFLILKNILEICQTKYWK